MGNVNGRMNCSVVFRSLHIRSVVITPAAQRIGHSMSEQALRWCPFHLLSCPSDCERHLWLGAGVSIIVPYDDVVWRRAEESPGRGGASRQQSAQIGPFSDSRAFDVHPHKD
jgi:hypothetical protein